ncbi:amidohydrolase family protein [Mycobacterium sp. NAZ190054]|uniref:amidohydrolase family protein n=1 Tax=Mycobacterium sp. NAZ190054 TaxID=1747766 RepID=UPI0007962007|nr:amidohydrolase family protein [Mycobacterium sp. NAZ190054]KWX67096.1 amidohydrolase [Mycobacterium sp. NAZ190054]
MEMNDMILVSTDDHIIEPADMFDDRMPAKFKDQAPKMTQLPNGVDTWEFCGQNAGAIGVGAVASWPKEEWGMDPVGHAEMRPGCYDIDARVRDMDANGIAASLNFPTMAGFSGHYLANVPDKELASAAIRAYNDWHIDEWCGSYPGRFIPLSILSLYDPEEMAREIRRVAVKGCTAVTLPEVPYLLNLPSFGSDYWEPVFKAACDTDTVLCLHIGLAINIIPNPDGFQPGRLIIMGAQMTAMTFNDLLSNGVFARFPTLKVALSEGGIGWIPFYMDRADRHVEQHVWTDVPGASEMLPSEVLQKNTLGCFITDRSSLRIRDRIGVDSIAWECDYPHSDSTWPLSPEMLWDELKEAECTDEEIHKITWQNSCRFFRFDLTKHRPFAEWTVGALRASATDVDVSETSKAQYRERYEARHATTVDA